MKNLCKNKKLIGAIAIILIAVILAIIITTNILQSDNNNQIAEEGYLATTAGAGSSLIANYILNGITIGGITGKMDVLNTSDATATEEDIAYGKTAYVDGKKITGTRLPSFYDVSGDETENTEVFDKYGNKVIIPAGFKVVNPSDDVTKGIIIEDVNAGDEYTKESQFVWIPVGEVKTENGTETIKLGRYSFSSENPTGEEMQIIENQTDLDNRVWENEIVIDSYFVEKISSTTNVVAKNLADFISKTINSGGYYLGRYEAGDAYATDSQHTNSGTANPVTCKSGVYPYNNVNQAEASDLCINMYQNNNFENDLINSYAWDTAIIFIQTFSGDEDYSIQRALRSSLFKCGETNLNGEYDIRCNIYDMSGNVREWSTETRNGKLYSCTYRGGCYDFSTTTDIYTGIRFYANKDSIMSEHAFRPIIYL